MKYLSLVWAAWRRKPTRTLLTFFAITSVFVLFGLLQGFNAGINEGLADTRADRLITMSRVSMREGLPISYLDRIQTVPGVVAVAHQTSFTTLYRNNQRVQGSAVDPAAFFSLFSEIHLPKDQLDALMHARTGIVIGNIIARKFGWKIGDHISLRSLVQANRVASQDWQFDVVGIYEVPEKPVMANLIITNYAYFDEARQTGSGTVDIYFLGLGNPNQAPAVAKGIDKLFENSPFETRTMTENEFTQSLLKSIVDLDFIVRAIIAAVFFSLLFSTSIVMMQSIRERTRDFAILKAVGFSSRSVLGLILVESVLLCVLAAMLGLAVAAALFPLATVSVNIPLASLPLSVIAIGVGLSLILAFVSGAPPAWRGLRLKIADALGRN